MKRKKIILGSAFLLIFLLFSLFSSLAETSTDAPVTSSATLPDKWFMSQPDEKTGERTLLFDGKEKAVIPSGYDLSFQGEVPVIKNKNAKTEEGKLIVIKDLKEFKIDRGTVMIGDSLPYSNVENAHFKMDAGKKVSYAKFDSPNGGAYSFTFNEKAYTLAMAEKGTVAYDTESQKKTIKATNAKAMHIISYLPEIKEEKINPRFDNKDIGSIEHELDDKGQVIITRLSPDALYTFTTSNGQPLIISSENEKNIPFSIYKDRTLLPQSQENGISITDDNGRQEITMRGDVKMKTEFNGNKLEYKGNQNSYGSYDPQTGNFAMTGGQISNFGSDNNPFGNNKFQLSLGDKTKALYNPVGNQGKIEGNQFALSNGKFSFGLDNGNQFSSARNDILGKEAKSLQPFDLTSQSTTSDKKVTYNVKYAGENTAIGPDNMVLVGENKNGISGLSVTKTEESLKVLAQNQGQTRGSSSQQQAQQSSQSTQTTKTETKFASTSWSKYEAEQMEDWWNQLQEELDAAQNGKDTSSTRKTAEVKIPENAQQKLQSVQETAKKDYAGAIAQSDKIIKDFSSGKTQPEKAGDSVARAAAYQQKAALNLQTWQNPKMDNIPVVQEGQPMSDQQEQHYNTNSNLREAVQNIRLAKKEIDAVESSNTIVTKLKDDIKQQERQITSLALKTSAAELVREQETQITEPVKKELEERQVAQQPKQEITQGAVSDQETPEETQARIAAAEAQKQKTPSLLGQLWQDTLKLNQLPGQILGQTFGRNDQIKQELAKAQTETQKKAVGTKIISELVEKGVPAQSIQSIKAQDLAKHLPQQDAAKAEEAVKSALQMQDVQSLLSGKSSSMKPLAMEMTGRTSSSGTPYYIDPSTQATLNKILEGSNAGQRALETVSKTTVVDTALYASFGGPIQGLKFATLTAAGSAISGEVKEKTGSKALGVTAEQATILAGTAVNPTSWLKKPLNFLFKKGALVEAKTELPAFKATVESPMSRLNTKGKIPIIVDDKGNIISDIKTADYVIQKASTGAKVPTKQVVDETETAVQQIRKTAEPGIAKQAPVVAKQGTKAIAKTISEVKKQLKLSSAQITEVKPLDKGYKVTYEGLATKNIKGKEVVQKIPTKLIGYSSVHMSASENEIALEWAKNKFIKLPKKDLEDLAEQLGERSFMDLLKKDIEIGVTKDGFAKTISFAVPSIKGGQLGRVSEEFVLNNPNLINVKKLTTTENSQIYVASGYDEGKFAVKVVDEPDKTLRELKETALNADQAGAQIARKMEVLVPKKYEVGVYQGVEKELQGRKVLATDFLTGYKSAEYSTKTIPVPLNGAEGIRARQLGANTLGTNLLIRNTDGSVQQLMYIKGDPEFYNIDYSGSMLWSGSYRPKGFTSAFNAEELRTLFYDKYSGLPNPVYTEVIDFTKSGQLVIKDRNSVIQMVENMKGITDQDIDKIIADSFKGVDSKKYLAGLEKQMNNPNFVRTQDKAAVQETLDLIKTKYNGDIQAYMADTLKARRDGIVSYFDNELRHQQEVSLISMETGLSEDLVNSFLGKGYARDGTTMASKPEFMAYVPGDVGIPETRIAEDIKKFGDAYVEEMKRTGQQVLDSPKTRVLFQQELKSQNVPEKVENALMNEFQKNYEQLSGKSKDLPEFGADLRELNRIKGGETHVHLARDGHSTAQAEYMMAKMAGETNPDVRIVSITRGSMDEAGGGRGIYTKVGNLWTQDANYNRNQFFALFEKEVSKNPQLAAAVENTYKQMQANGILSNIKNNQITFIDTCCAGTNTLFAEAVVRTKMPGVKTDSVLMMNNRGLSVQDKVKSMSGIGYEGTSIETVPKIGDFAGFNKEGVAVFDGTIIGSTRDLDSRLRKNFEFPEYGVSAVGAGAQLQKAIIAKQVQSYYTHLTSSGKNIPEFMKSATMKAFFVFMFEPKIKSEILAISH